MKTIMLLVCLIIRFECGMNPNGGIWGGGPDGPPCLAYYWGVISVKSAYRLPCTTAFARIGNTTFQADSNGVIGIEVKIKCNDNNPETKYFYCTVYSDTGYTPDGYNNFLWGGEFPLSQSERCFMELIIPLPDDA